MKVPYPNYERWRPYKRTFDMPTCHAPSGVRTRCGIDLSDHSVLCPCNSSCDSQWRSYTRARPGWKIHRPGSALPVALLCFDNIVNRK